MISYLTSAAAARHAGAGLVGIAALWWVALQAGGSDAEVTIWVIARGVEVRIDERPYSAPADPDDPLVVRLPPGQHRLTVRRDGRLLYQEAFRLEPGDQQVLGAFGGLRPEPPPPRELGAR